MQSACLLAECKEFPTEPSKLAPASVALATDLLARGGRGAGGSGGGGNGSGGGHLVGLNDRNLRFNLHLVQVRVDNGLCRRCGAVDDSQAIHSW